MRYNSEAARLLGVTLYMIRTFIAMGITRIEYSLKKKKSARLLNYNKT